MPAPLPALSCAWHPRVHPPFGCGQQHPALHGPPRRGEDGAASLGPRPRPRAFPTSTPFPGPQATSLGLRGHLRQGQSAPGGQQGEGEMQVPMAAPWPHPQPEPAWPAVPLCPKALTSGVQLPTAGTRDPSREGDPDRALGPEKALTLPARSLGQPAADTHSSGYKGTCLGGDAHLSRLHRPGRPAQDPAVRLGPELQGEQGWGPCLARSDLGGHQAVRV